MAQNRSNWTQLDYLNQDPYYTFQTGKKITGLCFITLSDSIDYYQTPIIITDKDKSQIVRIEFVDTLGILTTYKGKHFNSRDTLNPFNPWLWVNNPDYFRLAFECTDSIGDFYKISLNKTDFAWIHKKDKNFKKESIINFVLSWTSEPMGLDFDRKTNPLKKEPKETGEIIKDPLTGKYQIWRAEKSFEIQGEWIKVKTIKGETGWIKWKEEDKLVIRMYYAC